MANKDISKIFIGIKRNFNMFRHLFKRRKAYSVSHEYDMNGNYLSSLICLHENPFNWRSNFIRIRYDKNSCSIEGNVSDMIKNDIIGKDHL